MKVLKNNFNVNNFNDTNTKSYVESYPRKIICDQCGSELEYDVSDMEMGVLGCMHIKCPLCNEHNMLDDNENNIILTTDNVEFPTHFFHTSKETGAVDICNNNEVKKWINNAIAYFRKNKNEFAWHCSSGNLLVLVFRYDGDKEYNVYVTNNYYETHIPFESEDY